MTLHVFATVPACSSPYRILVIDDEAAVRVLLRRQLEQAGYAVVDGRWTGPVKRMKSVGGLFPFSCC